MLSDSEIFLVTDADVVCVSENVGETVAVRDTVGVASLEND